MATRTIMRIPHEPKELWGDERSGGRGDSRPPRERALLARQTKISP
jgi:hypothetical protein